VCLDIKESFDDVKALQNLIEKYENKNISCNIQSTYKESRDAKY